MMTDESPTDVAIKRNQAFILALTAFSGFFIPLCNIIIPLVLYLIWKRQNPYVASFGVKVVWTQVLFLIGMVLTVMGIIVGVIFGMALLADKNSAGPLLMILFMGGGCLLYLLVYVAWLGVAIYQSARAYGGKF